jgi:ribosomal protein S18 acetylase RimI-like enzyme
MIKYTSQIKDLKPDQLAGFFVGWPNPPSAEKHLEIIQNSYKSIIAFDGEKVVGFVNAISDGILSAYIPLIEVLPEYQKRGVARKLMELMIQEFSNFYMIDLVCDENLKSFYEKFGMNSLSAVGIRNFDKQSGE